MKKGERRRRSPSEAWCCQTTRGESYDETAADDADSAADRVDDVAPVDPQAAGCQQRAAPNAAGLLLRLPQ